MKRITIVFAMMAVLVLSFMSITSAANNNEVTFKPLKVYANDGKIIVHGKFWNYGDEAATIDTEKLQVTYRTPNNQVISAPVEFDNLNVSIGANETVSYSFTCETLQVMPIGKWDVHTNTISH